MPIPSPMILAGLPAKNFSSGYSLNCPATTTYTNSFRFKVGEKSAFVLESLNFLVTYSKMKAALADNDVLTLYLVIPGQYSGAYSQIFYTEQTFFLPIPLSVYCGPRCFFGFRWQFAHTGATAYLSYFLTGRYWQNVAGWDDAEAMPNVPATGGVMDYTIG